MNRRARVIVVASALSLALPLGACESFDPSDLEIFHSKKPLPGERQPVFPEGVPGVPQGVPPELIKGHEPPPAAAEPASAVAATEPAPEPEPVTRQAAAGPQDIRPAAQPKAKPASKPKARPKVAAKPKPAKKSSPTMVTVRPSRAQAAQTQTQTPGQVQWPDPPAPQQQPSSQVQWPDPPPPGSFSR